MVMTASGKIRLKHWVATAIILGMGGVGHQAHAETQVYWGDTHVHTKYSVDAFLNGNYTAGPDEAYRFAKGESVIHPMTKARVQLSRPLDFLVVSDHAMALGAPFALYHEINQEEVGFVDSLIRWFVARQLRSIVDGNGSPQTFNDVMEGVAEVTGDPVQHPANQSFLERASLLGDMEDIAGNVWHDIAETADRHYQPGKFTSFVGWEWTSNPVGTNLHRVVMSPMTGAQAKQFMPFSTFSSQYPEDLWKWLQETSARLDQPFIAIPHNANVSKGYMFAETTLKGEKIGPAYARLRAEFEPVTEITQMKGDSEVWPAFAPGDPFADFEPYTQYLQAGNPVPYVAHKADFVRSALKTGLKLEQEIGVNPFKVGVIGSTDTHTGLTSADEDNFQGKFPYDAIPENKFDTATLKTTGWGVSAAGYAAVWAEENTRQAIFAAFKRRETYASTGPRTALRSPPKTPQPLSTNLSRNKGSSITVVSIKKYFFF